MFTRCVYPYIPVTHRQLITTDYNLSKDTVTCDCLARDGLSIHDVKDDLLSRSPAYNYHTTKKTENPL